MANETNQIPEALLTVLRVGVPALLLTVDEDNLPHTAFTFAATAHPDRIAVVVDEGSRTLANIERTSKASVQIIAPGNLVYLLKGSVRISETRLASSPAPSRRAEIALTWVKNQAWREIAVTPLTYEYSALARARLEEAAPRLFAELRG
jgi:flavin reductase (DIM6/NTAB) family NADH-FMN oxidoreductase RutF